MNNIDKTMKNEKVDVEIIEDIDTTKEVEETEETETTDYAKIEELNKKIETLTQQKEHWRKKAQDKPRESGEQKPVSKELSTLDIVELTKADISEEDIPEIVEYAKFKGISITEALKSSVMKTTLAEKAEFRKANEAAASGKSRGGVSKTSERDLLDNAHKGILPKETDDEAINKLAKAAVKNNR